MRSKIMTCFIYILLFCSILSGQEKPMKYTPNKPKPGDKIEINFYSNNTDLEAEKNITAIIYYVVLDTIYCDEVPMVKSKENWECSYYIPEKAWGIGIKFSNKEGDIIIDNDGGSFTVFLYNNKGNFLKGTKASIASLSLNRFISSKSDTTRAYSLFNEEFAKHPSLTKYFLFKYSMCIKNEEPQNGYELIKKLLTNIEKQKDLDEKTLIEVGNTYGYILQNQEKAEYYKNIRIEKYPLGETAQADAYAEAKKQIVSNTEELEKPILEFQKKFGNNSTYVHMLWNELIKAYCKNKTYSELKTFLNKNLDELNNLSNMLIISAGAKDIAETNGDLNVAKELVDVSYKLYKEYKPLRRDFQGLTQAQIEARVNQYIQSILYYASFVYEKAGEPQKAMQFVQEAYTYENQPSEIKIMYVKLLQELNVDNDKALAISEELISSGKVSDEIKELNKEAYKLVHGSVEGYESYFESLRSYLLDELSEEIKAKLIDKPAPDFSLTDFDGNIITLSELKGKIVILDFWATWCAPCKASMPLMKKAVEKYADYEDVKFLFVDTFERGSNIEEKAKKWMTDNDFPFHVLFDTDGKVAKDGYGITAIPAKVFIDKNGNQRFLSTGFDKNKLLDEIDILIELLN